MHHTWSAALRRALNGSHVYLGLMLRRERGLALGAAFAGFAGSEDGPRLPAHLESVQQGPA